MGRYNNIQYIHINVIMSKYMVYELVWVKFHLSSPTDTIPMYNFNSLLMGGSKCTC